MSPLTVPIVPLANFRVRWSRPHIAQDTKERSVVPEPNTYFLFQGPLATEPCGQATQAVRTQSH